MNSITKIQNDFGEHLFNFIKGKVSSHADAEDIYQDVIYKIIRKSDQLNNSQSLKSWLFTIAKNQIIDFYRTRKNSIDIEKLPVSSISEQDEVRVYEELEGCLSGFINQLPNSYKEVITLSELNGYSQKELAEILGMNYVTLRSRVQRGRSKIREMIFDACTVDQDSVGRFVDCTPKDESSSCGNTQICGCA